MACFWPRPSGRSREAAAGGGAGGPGETARPRTRWAEPRPAPGLPPPSRASRPLQSAEEAPRPRRPSGGGGIAGRGQGEEKAERERAAGPRRASRGCGSANLRALTRGAAPRHSDISLRGAGLRELGRAVAALRDSRCTCPAPPPSRAPLPLAGCPGRSLTEPSPARGAARSRAQRAACPSGRTVRWNGPGRDGQLCPGPERLMSAGCAPCYPRPQLRGRGLLAVPKRPRGKGPQMDRRADALAAGAFHVVRDRGQPRS